MDSSCLGDLAKCCAAFHASEEDDYNVYLNERPLKHEQLANQNVERMVSGSVTSEDNSTLSRISLKKYRSKPYSPIGKL